MFSYIFNLIKTLPDKNNEANQNTGNPHIIATGSYYNILWYMSPENSVLEYFDDKIPFQTNKLIVKAMNKENNESNNKKIISTNNCKKTIEYNT